MLIVSSIFLSALLIFSYFFSPYNESKILPMYTLISLARITIVFVISLLFGILVGTLAALNQTAGKIIIPIFDVLQSVPILGYFPVLLVFIINIVSGYLGREVAVLVLLFTAMEWSIFFGVVGSIKSIPPSVKEAAATFNVKGIAYFRNVIIPAIIPALVSASTLAWNDGWTFDVASEFVSYNNQDYSVPGLGSFIAYYSLVNTNLFLAWLGLFIIGGVVVLTNQAIWHTLADKVTQHKSVFGVHIPERLVHPLRVRMGQARRVFGLRFRVEFLGLSRFKNSFSTKVLATAFIIILISIGIASNLSFVIPSFSIISSVLASVDAFKTSLFTILTLARLFSVYIVALFVSIVVAYIVSGSTKARKIFYSIYDLGRAIPYLALFPPLFATLIKVLPGEIGLEISSFFLIFMGMIWYIIYNVVSASSFLPQELKEVSNLFGFSGWNKIRHIMIPAILPAIITGSILAWGGGWNVVIYSESVTLGNNTYSLPGLGYLLDVAANQGSTPLVIFYLFVMSGIVILIGRLVWRRLLTKVEKTSLELT